VKYPALFEQFGRVPNFFTPNPNLKPEESTGWDAGAELSLVQGRLLFDVTYFANDLRDKITPAGFTVVNIPGTSTRDGLEVTSKAQLLPGLTVGAAYTYLLAEQADGQPDIRRPKNSGRVDVNYTFDHGRANINVAALYNGVMYDEALRLIGIGNFGGFSFPILARARTELDDYWLVRLAASYKLQPNLELFGRVENLLDAHYHEIYGFETAGIAAYAGVKVTFEDPDTASWAKYK
jgi:vitamin B12 transporter